jgi:ABC-type glycerol-3-phosphate transport system substrate-binding protein
VSIASFADVALYEALFNGRPAYKGIPSNGVTGNIIGLTSQLAMNAKCMYKDAAWSFMRRVLTEEYQNAVSDKLPTNIKAYKTFAEEAMRTPEYDENVNFVYYSVNGNIWRDPDAHVWTDTSTQPKTVYYFVDEVFSPITNVRCYALTKEGYDSFSEMLESVSKTMRYDTAIVTIIAEEIGSFFAGQKSVDEICDTIQSRAMLYVNE